MLLELHTTLKPGGVLLSSNLRGHNEEGWNSGRYGVHHDLESWRRYTSAARFVEPTHYTALTRRAARTAALAGERLAQVGVLKKVAFAGASHAMTSRYRAGQHDR